MNRETMELQITEMWQAVADLPRGSDPDGQAARDARRIEAKMREDMANQERLHAAAPDMAEALQTLMLAERMQSGNRDGATMGMISLAIDKARAALAKAGKVGGV